MEKLNVVYGYSIKDKSFRDVYCIGKVETNGECQGGYDRAEVLVALYDKEFGDYAIARTSKNYHPETIPLFVSGAKSKKELSEILRKLADQIDRE
ncbi:hypothetical protein L4F39_00690 [Vibrio paracholerae]|uniref:hypothetical protein n=1 Tax=Vibrio paracholerae TaxID=650003 RepID=UPI00209506E1|nr:hypothetical protein [Vibrio paracholerae]MCO7065242.1 hypothetical protein [Vibrio paracholerae]